MQLPALKKRTGPGMARKWQPGKANRRQVVDSFIGLKINVMTMKTANNFLRVSDRESEIVLDPSNYSYINIGTGERIVSTLSGIALTVYGIWATRGSGHPRESKWYELSAVPVGMYLIKRGVTGYCTLNKAINRNTAEGNDFVPIELSATVKVDKPRKEVYKTWKNLGNLPALFPHIKKIEVIDPLHSRWTVSVPNTYATVQWTAEISHDQRDERISWQSLEGSDIGNAGEVTFTDAEGGGTDVRVLIRYLPPAGKLGKHVAALFSERFQKILSKELNALTRQQPVV